MLAEPCTPISAAWSGDNADSKTRAAVLFEADCNRGEREHPRSLAGAGNHVRTTDWSCHEKGCVDFVSATAHRLRPARDSSRPARGVRPDGGAGGGAGRGASDPESDGRLPR